MVIFKLVTPSFTTTKELNLGSTEEYGEYIGKLFDKFEVFRPNYEAKVIIYSENQSMSSEKEYIVSKGETEGLDVKVGTLHLNAMTLEGFKYLLAKGVENIFNDIERHERLVPIDVTYFGTNLRVSEFKNEFKVELKTPEDKWVISEKVPKD